MKIYNCPFCNSEAEEETDKEFLKMLEYKRAVYCTGNCPVSYIRIELKMWQSVGEKINKERQCLVLEVL